MTVPPPPPADAPPAAADLLRVLAEETADRRARDALLRWADRLDAGEPPDALLAADGSGDAGAAGLPQEFAALLSVGLPADAVGEVLARLAAVVRHRADRRREWRAVFLYPAVLFVAAVAGLWVAAAFILPQFEQIYDDFGTVLPLPTRAVLSVGGLVTWGGLAAVAVLLVFVGAVWALHLILRARGGGGLLRLVPGAGGGAGELATFCHLLAMLVGRGVPLPRALAAVSATLHDPRLAFDTLELSAAVGAGVPLADAAFGRRRFPPAVRHAFGWQDDPPAFAAGLAEMAELQERRAAATAAAWVVLVEPVFVVLLGLLIGATAFALYLPLINLLDDLA